MDAGNILRKGEVFWSSGILNLKGCRKYSRKGRGVWSSGILKLKGCRKYFRKG
jgi:hypothetical protein